MTKSLSEAAKVDAHLAQALREKRTATEIIIILVRDKQALAQQVIELAAIAPYKIHTPDGEVAVWRCPDEFVPFRNGTQNGDGTKDSQDEKR